MPIQMIYIFDSYVTVEDIDDIDSYDNKYRSRDNKVLFPMLRVQIIRI